MEPYNRFLSKCTKTGGYKKSEDGEFPATGVLLIYSSLLSHVTPTGKLIYVKSFNGLPFMGFINDETNNKLLNGVRGIGNRVEGILIGCVRATLP